MSFDALAWAAKQNTGSSGTKLVLLGLAECADRSHNLAFPSVAALVEFSCLDRKSVIANLARLESGGFISDTGRKVGQTGQIKVWQINVETVPKTEQSQKRNSSDFPPNSPKNGTRNKSEPGSSKKATLPKKKRVRAFVLPDDIPADEWRDYEEMRVVAKKPMTDSIRAKAVARLRKLAEAGWPPGDVLSHSTLNNYQGLFPPKDDGNGRTNGMARLGKPGNHSSGNGLIDAIRESRANREAVPWDAGDAGGMPRLAGLG